MALNIGQTVGDYRVIGVIGSGGMGTVYKVQHLISDRIEAMKLILPNLIDSPELADRFMREIKVQARLSHPNIASLLNALRLDNQLLMVMEYIEGATLQAVLRQGRMEPVRSIDIVLQVLSALDYAHAQGVIHRDIKPANIMLTAGGVAKLMDFGIARSLTDRQLTQAGAAVGSVYYMSPEQVQGAGVDHRSDLYSVGIMLYEMVTGARPISGESSWAIMNAHVNQIPRSPVALNGDLPDYLCLAILKAIEKNPDARHQNASAFADILKMVQNRYSARAGRRPASDFETAAIPPQTPAYLQPTELIKPSAPPIAVATPTPSPSITPIPSSGSSSASAKRFSSAELERVKRDLAVYIGPMARIIVDRAAKKAGNLRELYEILSAEVPAGRERAEFQATRPR